MLSPDTAPQCEAHKHKLEFMEWLKRKGVKCLSDEEKGPRGFATLRHLAVAAGLGIFRKNNFFYDESGRSWRKLEAFLIDKECEFMASTNARPCPDNCALCIKNCLTGTLCEPYMMNPLKCISFITNFGAGKIPHPLKDNDLNEWISGCDACQDACPFNKRMIGRKANSSAS